MISVKGAVKIFKNSSGYRALDGISFEGVKGDVIGFLGPNGAGKTTTMRLLTGIYEPTGGKVEVGGFSPVADRMKVLKITGYLPENNPLYPEMTVGEYFGFIAAVKGSFLTRKIIDDISLSDVIGKKIEGLSRGFRQRVGLAAALIGDPKVLILDEPTSGLDPLEQEKIKSLILKLSKGKTIIFSTHILSEVEAVATKLVIINRGRIVFDGKKPKGKGGVERLFKKLVKL